MPEARFDRARGALDEIAPTTDLWAAAQQRAGSPLPAMTAPPGRRSRWRWAAAAVIAAVPVLAVVALWPDPQEDVPVDTVETTTSHPSVVTVPSDRSACGYGVSGDPIVILPGPAEPPLVDAGGQPPPKSVGHLELGELSAEIHVPGIVLVDLVGERVEEVELARGPAQAWITEQFVQVRWFPDSRDACDSFTVSVGGGTTQQNRAAAMELADRLLLPSDLARPLPDDEAPLDEVLASTDWIITSVRADGDEVLIPDHVEADRLTFTFERAGRIEWANGCNFMSGRYEVVDDHTLVIGDEVLGTLVGCPPNGPWTVIDRVMSGGHSVRATLRGRELVLSEEGDEIRLVPR